MKNKKTPTPKEIAQAKKRFGQCRVYGHWWDSVQIVFERDGYVDILRCENCNTARLDRIDRKSLKISGRSYRYPKDYELSKPSHGRMAMRVQRLQSD